MSGSERHLGGVFEAGVATVQPAALVRGLRAAALAAGVSIWEKTPMLNYEVTPRGVTVRVPGATIAASHRKMSTIRWGIANNHLTSGNQRTRSCGTSG